MSGETVNKAPARKKRKHSLSRRIGHTVLAGCILLGIVLLFVTLTAFVYELSMRQIDTAFNLSVSARKIVDRNVDAQVFADRVMGIYNGLSEEERSQVGTDEYYARFRKVADEPGYKTLRSIIADFRDTGVTDYIYFAVYDRRTSAVVYVLDTDMNEKTYCPPGHWEKLRTAELNRFLEWDGNGALFDFGDTEEYGYMFTSGAPVGGTNDCRSFILTDITADNIFRKAVWFVVNYTLVLIILISLLSFAMMRRMEEQVVDPITRIETAAKAYVKDKQDNVETDNHFTSLNIGTDDEIEDLSLTMGGMEMDLNEYEKNLAAISAEKERVGSELKLARKIQAAMLPCIFPAFPDRTDFDIYAQMDPAKEVGGDFYDFFLIDHDKLGIVIADVSGKGVPAALFMMVTKSMLKTALLAGAGAAEALTNVNRQICGNKHEGMFVTIWDGILDLKTGVLTAANAGHEYPLIMKPGWKFDVLKDKHGFIVGGIDGISYKEYTVDLEPGSKVLVYTDGATEATDSSEKLFGLERLTRSAADVSDSTPEEIIKAVRKDIDDFVGDAEQFDDITLLCLEYDGQGNDKDDAGRQKMSKVLFDITRKAEIKNVAEVTDLVDAELEKLECNMKAQVQLNIAIDEIFSNIAKYAYETPGGDARVIMSFCEERNEVSLTFMDTGTPYDPTAREDPDISLPASQRGIGGLGILLVRKSMDGLEYEYKDGYNCLTLRKIIK